MYNGHQRALGKYVTNLKYGVNRYQRFLDYIFYKVTTLYFFTNEYKITRIMLKVNLFIYVLPTKNTLLSMVCVCKYKLRNYIPSSEYLSIYNMHDIKKSCFCLLIVFYRKIRYYLYTRFQFDLYSISTANAHSIRSP